MVICRVIEHYMKLYHVPALNCSFSNVRASFGYNLVINQYFFKYCLEMNRQAAKFQNYTFDGVFRYTSPCMLIQLFIGWALV